MRRALVIAAVFAGGCEQILGIEDPAAAPAELCTPANVAVDDDEDGAIDEGCAWNLGVPQWLPPLAVPARAFPLETVEGNLPTWISADGLRLYLVLETPTRRSLHVAARPSPSEPFAVATPVAGLDGLVVRAATFSADETIAVLEAVPAATPDAPSDLWIARRGDAAGAFATVEPLAELSTPDAGEERPTLRGDGREIVYQVTTTPVHSELRRAVREQPDGVFEPRGVLDQLGGERTGAPYLSLDGLTLFFHVHLGAKSRIHRAERIDGDLDAGFASSTPWLGGSPGAGDVFTPVVSEKTRELFVSSNAPFSTAARGLWRVQICRDRLCAGAPLPCLGALSDDGLHCYRVEGPAANHDQAAAICQAAGGHLLDLHSPAEIERAFRQVAGIDHGVWIGARRPDRVDERVAWTWPTGAPWTFENWGGAEPNNGGDSGFDEACAAVLTVNNGTWTDYPCSTELAALCEVESYPTW